MISATPGLLLLALLAYAVASILAGLVLGRWMGAEDDRD